MNDRSPEGLLLRLLRESEDLERPSYLMLRAEPSLVVLVFESGAAAPRSVFKAARGGIALEALEKEHRILSDLVARAPAGFRETLPRPIVRGEQSGLVGYLSRALPGARMKDIPPRRLFGPSTVGPTLRRVSDWLLELYETVGIVRADGAADLRRELLDGPVEKYLKWFHVTEDERALLLESSEKLPDPATASLPLCRGHGDFSPANVLWSNGRIGVIDYEFALEPCLPLDDLLHFLASMKSSTSARGREAARRAFFEETFYGSGHLSRAAREAVHGLAGRLGIDLALLEPLFVLTWVRYAVRAVELQLQPLDLASLTAEPERLWRRLDAEPEEFLPVTRIRGGICGNVRQHVEMRDRFVLANR